MIHYDLSRWAGEAKSLPVNILAVFSGPLSSRFLSRDPILSEYGRAGLSRPLHDAGKSCKSRND